METSHGGFQSVSGVGGVRLLSGRDTIRMVSRRYPIALWGAEVKISKPRNSSL